ncbi:unnamed protein product [Mytilus coruscus]|uniref:Uncharacterized protein n=1 Tax=Mytilus coruscus TaxID=42192 RepID=A0A6J8EIP4_MYTCO|nr:unnamed protein product [Mytilus coruscus]
MSFQIAYCGSDRFEIDEQREYDENKDKNIQTRLQNNSKDAEISEVAKSFATGVTSKWLNFSFQLHDFVNTNYNRYIEDFTHDEVENKIKCRRNCAIVVKQVANEILPIDSGHKKTDSKKTETDTVATKERRTETDDALINPPVKISGFLSSAVKTWTSDDNLVNDKNVNTVEQVQPEGCFCWPLVHLILKAENRRIALHGIVIDKFR